MERDEVRRRLLAVMADSGLAVQPVGEDRWMTVLTGEWKRTIPLLLHLDERSLRATSLLAGVPDEGHEDVYRLLLQRNQRPAPIHFALDDEGDIVITGVLPLAAVTDRSLGELLGAVLTWSDDTFNQVLRTGFKTYIDAEQRWRAANGLPPNPVTSAG